MRWYNNGVDLLELLTQELNLEFDNKYPSPLYDVLIHFVDNLPTYFYDMDHKDLDSAQEIVEIAMRNACENVLGGLGYSLLTHPLIYRWFDTAIYEFKAEGKTNLDLLIAEVIADNLYQDVIFKHCRTIWEAYLDSDNFTKN